MSDGTPLSDYNSTREPNSEHQIDSEGGRQNDDGIGVDTSVVPEGRCHDCVVPEDSSEDCDKHVTFIVAPFGQDGPASSTIADAHPNVVVGACTNEHGRPGGGLIAVRGTEAADWLQNAWSTFEMDPGHDGYERTLDTWVESSTGRP